MNLTGTQVWVNELGSTMTFTVGPDNLTITGTYQSKVGHGSTYTFALIGQIDPQPINGSCAIGWTVVWNNGSIDAHSVTTWSGQLQWNASELEIVTTWLLTSEQDPANDWQSTLVGMDTFVQQGSKTGAKAVTKTTGKKRPSHPAAAM